MFLESIITTNEALRLSLAMSGIAVILTFGMLAIIIYLLNEWKHELDGLKMYLEMRNFIPRNHRK